MKSKFLIGILAVAMMSCGGNKATSEATDAAESENTEAQVLPLNGKWRLADYAGETEMCVMDSTANYYLEFNDADHTFGMTTDCNSIGGQYKATADSLTFENIAVTQMLCPDEAVENAMKSILPRVDIYVITPDSTLLIKADSRILATFKYAE